MSFDYEEKPSSSRFVDIIWQHPRHERRHVPRRRRRLLGHDLHPERRRDDRVLLSGPSSKITPVPYQAGNRNVGIRFVRGSFLTHVPTTVDGRHDRSRCRCPPDDTFELAGHDWPVPTYETVDDFVAELERHELLSDDPLVMAALRGDDPTTSTRSVQRHFSQVTGLTANRIRQIVRARTAAEMLQDGASRSSTSPTSSATPTRRT